MNLPLSCYWIGTILINYFVMVIGYLCILFGVMYFIPIYRTFEAFPLMYLGTLLHSLAGLLHAYLLSLYFGNGRFFSLCLQFSSMLLSLSPAYVISYLADEAVFQRPGLYARLSSQTAYWLNILFCLFFPHYPPLGTLIGVANVIAISRTKRTALRVADFFSPKQMPVWGLIGSFFQV